MRTFEEHILGTTAAGENLLVQLLALDRSWCPNPVAEDAGRGYSSRTEQILKRCRAWLQL
jgi:hypothetical protein